MSDPATGETRASARQHGPTLLRTKLFVPRPHPDLVPRSRLLARLDEGLASRLVLVCAPAGSGKTTLLAQWAASTGSPMAWLSLDPGDNDPVRFWSYVVTALRPSLPAGAADDLLALLAASGQQPIEGVLAGLLNELAIAAVPCLFVLDDYHVVENPQIHEALTFLLNNLPPTLRLVIASRNEPPLALPLMRARRQLLEIRIPDLRFTGQETAAFLNDVMGLDLAPDDVSLLEQRTEGWAAGLQLAALSMQGIDDPKRILRGFAGTHRFVFDYLAQEVLDRQPEDVRDFMLRSAVLDRLNGELCDALALDEPDARSGTAPGADMLQSIERANLFLMPLDQERRWYRYHHLFGEFLRAELERREGPERVAELSGRASRWHAAHDNLEEAVRYALAAGEPYAEMAASLITAATRDMFRSGALPAFLSWMDRLPERVRLAHPELLIPEAWALLATGQIASVEPALGAIEKQLGAVASDLRGGAGRLPGGTRSALIEIAVMRSSLAFQRFDLASARVLAQDALAWMDEATGAEFVYNNAAELRPPALFALAMSYEFDGDAPAAVAPLEQAVQMGAEQGNSHIVVLGLGHLAAVRALQGSLHDAAATYRRALAAGELPGGRQLPISGTARSGLGHLLYEWNDLAGAQAGFDEGIALGKQWRNWEALLSGYTGTARVCRARGDFAGARGSLDEVVAVSARMPNPNMLPAIEAARARLAVESGDLDGAAAWLGSSGPFGSGEIPYLREGEALIAARVLTATGKPGEALELLERLAFAAEAGGRDGRIVEIRMLQAHALEGIGQAEDAAMALQQALGLAATAGYVRLFLDEGQPMFRLLQRLPVAEPTLPVRVYLQHLLSAFDADRVARPAVDAGASPVRNAAPPVTGLVEPLSERELEVLRLLAAGLANQAIADRLIVSPNTVKSHLKNIYAKLGAATRTQALARARDLELLS